MVVKIMNIRKQIGKNIKKARVDIEMSQEKLADKINTSHAHINKVENGNYSYLNPDIIYRIAKTLEVPFHTLFVL